MGFREIPTTAYEIKYTESWKWLQRLCVRVLFRLKALRAHFDREMTITSVVIDPETVAIKIIQVAEEQLARLQYRPERILIGRKQFEEIITGDTPAIFGEFSFEIPMSRTTPSWNGLQPRLERFGVPIYVIPWMDGVLVL